MLSRASGSITTSRRHRMGVASRWVALVTAVGVITAACGGTTAPTSAPTSAGSAAATATAAPVTLTVVVTGGSLKDAQVKAWFDPFQASHPNIKIQYDEPFDYAKLKAMVEAKNVTWDVMLQGSDFGLGSSEQYLEKIDCTIVPCSELNPDKFKTGGYRVPFEVTPLVLSWRSDIFAAPNEPKTYADVWDTTKFPGKRVFWKGRAQGLLELALLADGVKPASLYPLDVARAFKKFDQIKNDIVWAGSSAQCAQYLRDKVAPIGVCFNGRVWDAQQAGAPLKWGWDNAVTWGGYLVIPKGSPHITAAMQLIAYITSADNNHKQANLYPYGPVNIKSVGKVDPKMAQAAGDGQNLVFTDDVWWNDNFDKVNVQFLEWLNK